MKLIAQSWLRSLRGAIFSTLLMGALGAPVGNAQKPVAYYQFNGNAADSSGHGNDGTPVNVVSCQDRFGVANHAYRFNGNGYVGYPDRVFGPSTPGFTWSAWVQPDPGANDYWGIMYHGTVAGEASASWNGQVYNFALKFVHSGWKGVEVNAELGLSHVVFVYSRGAHAQIWVNGELKGNVAVPQEDLNVDPSFVTSAGVGAFLKPWGASNYFQGVIDDVRIYNRALSGTEIQQLYSGTGPASDPQTSAVVQTGDTVPGITGKKIASIGAAAINERLHVAFKGAIAGNDHSSSLVSGNEEIGIWADDSHGVRQLVVRSGTLAPGIDGARFADFSDPVYNNQDAVAFLGELMPRLGGVIQYGPLTNSTGVWSTDGGALHLVARQGQQAPGLANGTVFASFDQIALPDQGGVVLLATASGNSNARKGAKGIWAVDTAGTLQLILSENARMNGKVVRELSFLAPAAGVGGQTRSFAQSTGDILYKATFTDDSWGVYKVIFP